MTETFQFRLPLVEAAQAQKHVTVNEALARLVVLSKPDGAQLTLGQIAQIEESYSPSENRAFLDGTRAVYLQVDKALGADALRVFDAVSELIETERTQVPPSLRLEVVQA